MFNKIFDGIKKLMGKEFYGIRLGTWVKYGGGLGLVINALLNEGYYHGYNDCTDAWNEALDVVLKRHEETGEETEEDNDCSEGEES